MNDLLQIAFLSKLELQPGEFGFSKMTLQTM